MKLFNILLIIILLMFVACNGHDDISLGVKGVLISDVWFEKEHYEDPDGDGLYTTPSGYNCQEDNEWHFHANGKFDYLEGVDACEPDFPINLSGKWQLNNGDKDLVLFLSGNLVIYTLRIGSFSNDSIELFNQNTIDPSLPPTEKIVLYK